MKAGSTELNLYGQIGR